MKILQDIKKSNFGQTLRLFLRIIRSTRSYGAQLFFSYKYYHTKKLAQCCDIKCRIKYVGEQQTRFPHPVGIVIGMGVSVGSGCIIFQNATIGTKSLFQKDYPTIGNEVIIGANSVIIGAITIGNNVIIGASTLVNEDVPNNAIVVGNPMRIIGLNDKSISEMEKDMMLKSIKESTI